MSRPKFTITEGLIIQSHDMAIWKRKLNKRTFEALVAWVACCNDNLTAKSTGYDVVRGNTLTEYVLNCPS